VDSHNVVDGSAPVCRRINLAASSDVYVYVFIAVVLQSCRCRSRATPTTSYSRPM